MKQYDHFFYSPRQIEGVHHFTASEAGHAVKALRLGVGDGIRWLDGAGGRFGGLISTADRQGMQARATQTFVGKPQPALHLAVGILHDATRLEWLVEKATELGATKLTLLSTARVERSRYRMSRLESKALAALKQSGRLWLPKIREASLGDFLQSVDPSVGRRMLFHCYDELPRQRVVATQAEPVETIVLIGPEGDFTQQEIEEAQRHGFSGYTLGEARLRTETAAIVALTLAG